MEEALAALNQLVTDGVIRDYAIGGAIGASFYISAMQTEDVDAFVFLPESQDVLVSLTPVYEALVRLGGKIDREYIRFGGWPVQILTDADALLADAIRSAITTPFKETKTRVFRPEHLCAVARHVGRRKDLLRVETFLEQSAVDVPSLIALLRFHHLSAEEGRLDQLQGGLDGDR